MRRVALVVAALTLAACPVYGNLGQWERVAVGTTGEPSGGGTTTSTTSSTGGAGTGGGTGGAVQCAPGPASGTPLWGELFTSMDTVYAQVNGVATDPAGNVILTGSYYGSISFGGGVVLKPAVAPIGVFVAKLDRGGGYQWAKSFGGSMACTICGVGRSVAVDAAGNIVVTGIFDGAIDFGGDTFTTAPSNTSMFLAKLDPSGEHLWSKSFGSAERTLGQIVIGQTVALDATGDILVSGTCTGSVSFGGATFTTPGFFVAKLDPNGAHVWSESFVNAQQTEYGNGLALDAAGDVFVAGDFTGSIDLGGGTLKSMGAADMFIGKLDPGGGYLWGKRFTANDGVASYGVATDTSGNVIFTGSLSAPVDFGGGTLTPTGEDLFIAKFDPGGAHVWSERFPSGDEAYATGTAVDASGNVYLACYYCGSVDLGGTTVTSVGDAGPGGCFATSAFFASFDVDGGYRWAKNFNEIQPGAVAPGVAVDLCGTVIVAGSFSGTIDLGGIPMNNYGGEDAFAAAYAR